MDDSNGSAANPSGVQGQVMPMEEWGCSSGWGVRVKGEQGKREDRRLVGVCGLANSGNSCYMNAVLQCLFSTVPLVEHLLSSHKRSQLAKHNSPVAGVFVQLLQEVWQGQGGTTSPGEVRALVSSLHPQFNNQSQQDAQELLLLLLNALHDDLKNKGERRQTRSSQRLCLGRKSLSSAASSGGFYGGEHVSSRDNSATRCCVCAAMDTLTATRSSPSCLCLYHLTHTSAPYRYN
eukprot:XP_014038670.1 PREDICTED: putative ubiquitin carboxyl-terminal hydrolase 50 [Salmo salar]